LPTGQYVRRLPSATNAPANGTRFNVQDFFIGLAEDREGLNAPLPPLLLEKMQSLPVYETLSAEWARANSVESQIEPEESAR
jgi:hypothetical protein